MDQAWSPTHKITFTPAKGEPQVEYVMLVDGAGYTREEWDAADSAAWGIDDGPHGAGWYCEGQATPGGANGEVEVEEIPAQ